jgi:hypothetical protein
MAIRVRGMDTQSKFFDEETETILLSPHEVMTRIRSLPELDTDLHVTSLKNELGGTYRVAWLNTEAREGFYDLGLEIVEPEGDLWEITFPPGPAAAQETLAETWLECRRCHQKIFTTVPEAESEFIRQGFRVARPCDQCRSTTAWEFASPEAAGDAASELVEKKGAVDLRSKGRAPLRLRIKVIRREFGVASEDVCQTENVSRTGAYFFTAQHYRVGEIVEAALPYKEGELAIPVQARVVRLDHPASSGYVGVAIHLLAADNG